MSTGTTFEDYLFSKKIDSERFRSAEPDLWNSWKREFEQMHPNSFTVQKLNLINPVRRRYQLPLASAEKKPEPALPQQPATTRPASKPGKPIIRPKLS